MRIAYVTDITSSGTERAAQQVRRALAFLRQAGHRVQLLRPRQAGEAARHDADEWRLSGTVLRRAFADPALAPQHVHVATSGALGWGALQAARACGLRSSADYADPTQPPPGRDSLPVLWRGPMRRLQLSRLHALADVSFVPTVELADSLRRQGYERLQVIGRGVDAVQFSPIWRDEWQRHEWRAGSHNPVLLYAGRLAADQNVELALDTFEQLRAENRSLRMVVVGEGPLRARLKSLHPHVRFVGPRHGSDLARHCASADVLLLPQAQDDFGDTLLEGLASGLVVVCFDTAAARVHLEGGRCGWIARPGRGGNPRESFLAATRRALVQWSPGSTRRLLAREAALRAPWDPVLAAWEQALREQAVEPSGRERPVPA